MNRVILLVILTSCFLLGAVSPLLAKKRVIVISGNGSQLDITIKTGETIRWFCRLDGITIFSPDEKFPTSPILNNGDVYQITFEKAGIFFYRVSGVKYGNGIIFVRDDNGGKK